MKTKFFILICLMGFGASSVIAQHHNPMPNYTDTTIIENCKSWDTINKVWVNNYQTITTYDAHENIISDTRNKWKNSKWVKEYQDTWTYDDKGNLISKIYHEDIFGIISVLTTTIKVL